MKASSCENVLSLLGVLLLGVWGVSWTDKVTFSSIALADFRAGQTESVQKSFAQVYDPASGSPVDFSLWSLKRIRAFMSSLTESKGVPLGILRIAKIRLEVPVFDGTDDLVLNRGVGRILGTARIDQSGNLGIAGHRDGFFRGLKDVSPGDVVDLVLPGKTVTFVIDTIQIVNPEDVRVLHPTPNATLTLVTCYPFYFIGSAPQRYIVSASVKKSNGLAQVMNEPSHSVGESQF
jgi:sortase A